ncbi:hypothetical protein HO173_005233 [Letharia columbiana]|uniref:Uncharacterized protein n=1 Tax=Letharia columbiana TaxID=112416 RepID=A0A8H6FXD8_9LECA|nr:uncharacterized protein HO173_005233 [Letharia columbiana]KAF6236452.1 hypothetical protein HO173_005233 [Letharia columbiana]
MIPFSQFLLNFNSGLMYAPLLGAAAFCVQKAPRELLGPGRRIQFNLAFEGDIKELRTTPASHVMTIYMPLTTQLLSVNYFPTGSQDQSAEIDWEKGIQSLKISYEAHTTLLKNVYRRQDEASADLSVPKEGLTVLQEKLDLLHRERAGTSIKLEEQQNILEAIEPNTEFNKNEAGDNRYSA